MKRISFASLRVRLIFLVLIAAIPALGITLYSGLEYRNHTRNHALDDALRLAQEISKDHDHLIQNARRILFTLSKISQVQQQDKAACCKIFAEIMKQSDGYTALVAAKPDGDVFASSIPITSPINYSDRPWFQRLLKTRDFVIGEYLIGRVSGKPLIVFAYPILDDIGNLKTILSLGMDLDWLKRTVVKNKLPEGTSVTVIDSDGTILFRYPEPEKFVGKSMPEVPIFKVILTKREGVEETVGLGGVPRLFGFTSLGKGVESVHLSVGIPRKIALAKADRVMKQSLAYLGLITLLALAAAWFIGGLFVIHPVNRLLDMTKRLTDGDLNARVGPSYGKGEIGRLGYAFDQMGESLQHHEAERKQAEEALRESEVRFQELFNEAPVGYHEVDAEGRIIQVNHTELEMLGYTAEEMLGQPVWKFAVEEKKSQQAISTILVDTAPTTQSVERTYRRKDGTTFPVLIERRVIRDANGRVKNIRSTVQDITELKRMEKEKANIEEQFRQSQKMEAIGQLAGGIAHDFNNLLTIIKGYTQLSLIELEEGNPLKGNIDEVQKAADRAAVLTRQLLAFSRRQVLDMKVLDLNTVLGDLDKMLRRIIGEDIELVTLLAEDLGRVRADPGQLEQVIMNLVVNARDAMPSGGKLTVETANVELDEVYARNHVAVIPGRYVMLSVSDTGVGMVPEVRERIFEPFFTTKEKGKGTGLGLSTVYGIVKQSEGNIWVYSEPGQGTTFKIYLPRVDEPSEEFKEKVVKGGLPHGNETILVVEDEEEVRKLTVRILKGWGYRVLETSGGDEALLIGEQEKEPLHLILVDVVMEEHY